MVQENTKAEVTEVKGSLTYEDKVIQKIVGLALESVNGLLSVFTSFPVRFEKNPPSTANSPEIFSKEKPIIFWMTLFS